MMRKIVTWAILVPLSVIIVMFAVANRALVTLSFDPFNAREPAFALTLPLFMLIFLLVALGVLIGGCAAWLKQHKWRARARQAEAEARSLRSRLDAQTPRHTMPAPFGAPHIAVPPAA